MVATRAEGAVTIGFILIFDLFWICVSLNTNTLSEDVSRVNDNLRISYVFVRNDSKIS